MIWTITLVINQMSYSCTLKFQVSQGSAATDLR